MKYWVNIDEAVEGPYEAAAIPFIEGFGPDVLVSPDPGPDEWLKASEVAELWVPLGIPEPQPVTPPVQKQPEPVPEPPKETSPSPDAPPPTLRRLT